MIPYSYNMVDMGGIDLAEANGTVVPGIYSRIVDAVNSCGDVVLYNWKFAAIEITPQYTQILLDEGELTINGAIQVTELDQISIIGTDPPPPPVTPLTATANGQYNPEPPTVGFSPVTVAVPPPQLTQLTATENRQYNPESPAVGFSSVTVAVPIPPSPTIVNLSISENGTYNPQSYNADGFGVVSVNVSGGGFTNIEAVHVWTNRTGGSDASVYVQEGYVYGYEFIPDGEAVSVLYSTVQVTPREFDLISLAYVGSWKVTAKDDLVYNYTDLLLGESVTWQYTARVDYIFVLKGE